MSGVTITPYQELDGLGARSGDPITFTVPLSYHLLGVCGAAIRWLPLSLVLVCLTLRENRKLRSLALFVCAGLISAMPGFIRSMFFTDDLFPSYALGFWIVWALVVAYISILLLVFRLGRLRPGKRVIAVLAILLLSGGAGWLGILYEVNHALGKAIYPVAYLQVATSLILAMLGGRWIIRKRPTPLRFRRWFLFMLVIVLIVLAFPALHITPNAVCYITLEEAIVYPIVIGILAAGVVLVTMTPFLVLLLFDRLCRERVCDLLGLEY